MKLSASNGTHSDRGARQGERPSALIEGMRQALLREGLPEQAKLADVLGLEPAAVHRLSYAGLMLEAIDRLAALQGAETGAPSTRCGSFLRDHATNSDAPHTLEEAWVWVDRFIHEKLRPGLGNAEPAGARLHLYLDTVAEADRATDQALQLVRIIDLTNPARGYTPGGPQAGMVERLDPMSIWAWYSRHLTTPFHIDSGAPRHELIGTGFVYGMPRGRDPERSVDELAQETRDLLEEAALLRQGSIPNAAMVEIQFPPFVALCFAEISPSFVLMEALDEDSRSLPVVFLPNDRKWVAPNTGVGPTGTGQSFCHVAAAIALVGAAALRDFWVVEDRERTLGQPRLDRVRGMNSRRRHVIYLPRIRYRDPAPGGEDDRTGLGASLRRAHWRSAHFRKLPEGQQASRKQRLIAEANGRIPPEGSTWVRGATVAGEEVEARYRSRSAVKALFDTTVVQTRTHGELNWFGFERLCSAWLRRQGFEELARKGGDRGADIYCSRQRGDALEFWVVQCKHVRDKVGPEVIREVHGAAALRKADRAMVITSSAFTSGAIETARELGVLLADGDEISH